VQYLTLCSLTAAPLRQRENRSTTHGEPPPHEQSPGIAIKLPPSRDRAAAYPAFQYILITRESDNLLTEIKTARRLFLPYTPKPLDTSGVLLTKDLNTIVELLAKNTHDNWASLRMKEGWRYGPERNDALKEHPCLVPYEELPESEKEHDRKVVRELLKTLLSLGFGIRRK